MRFEGTLDVFGLPDLFHLLARTGKTGTLSVTAAAGRHGGVAFIDGVIVGADADPQRTGLARRLVGCGVVDDGALTAALDRAGGPTGVVTALRELGAVDAAVLAEVGREHVIDVVFDLVRWVDGSFALQVDRPAVEVPEVSVSVEEVVSEVDRRLAEWARVAPLVPSTSAAVGLALAIGGETVQLGASEWALLALLDGHRTVADLVVLTGRGEYAIGCALAALVQRGLVTVGSAPARELTRRQALLGAGAGAPPRAAADRPAPPATPDRPANPVPPDRPASPVPSQSAPTINADVVARLIDAVRRL